MTRDFEVSSRSNGLARAKLSIARPPDVNSISAGRDAASSVGKHGFCVSVFVVAVYRDQQRQRDLDSP